MLGFTDLRHHGSSGISCPYGILEDMQPGTASPPHAHHKFKSSYSKIEVRCWLHSCVRHCTDLLNQFIPSSAGFMILDELQPLILHVSDLRFRKKDSTVQCEGRYVGGYFPSIFFRL